VNLEEFVVELGKTKDTFKWLKNGNYIRAKQENSEEVTYFCPITAVVWNKTGRFFDTTQTRIAARTYLEMSSDDIAKIVSSSDLWTFSPDLDISLRKNIIETLGLQ
jgi:hypothetical protein